MSDPSDNILKTKSPPRPRRLGCWFVIFVVLIAISVLTWLQLRPTSKQLLDRGIALLRSDPTRSERLVRQALTKGGGHVPDAEITLCRILMRKGETEEFSRLFSKLDLPACRPDLLLAFGKDALLSENQSEAHLVLESLAYRGLPESMIALELLINDYQEWGQDDQSLAACRELLRLEPQTPVHWNRLVQLLVGMSRDTECVEVIHEARGHNLPPDLLREFRNLLIQRLINLGNIPAIQRELAGLRDAEGDTDRVLGHQAYLFRLEGKLDLALETISKLIRGNQTAPFAYFTRGIIYLDLRRFPDATKDLERVLAAQPFNSAAEFKLSEALRGSGKNDLADLHREHAAQLIDKQKRIATLLKQRQETPRKLEIYTELSQLHLDLGQPETAKKWQQRGLKLP